MKKDTTCECCSTTAYADSDEDAAYRNLLIGVEANLAKIATNRPVFKTDATGLFEVFIKGLPAPRRQHYTCNTCRHFFNHYAGLVYLNEDYTMHPLAFDCNVPDFFAKSADAVNKKVKAANITGVFETSEKALGTPVTHDKTDFHHLHMWVPSLRLWTSKVETAEQKMSSRGEDYKMLREAVYKYKVAYTSLQKAVSLLRSGLLYRAEKVLPMAEWFMKVIEPTLGINVRSIRRIWFLAATAPTGFCHINSSMLGSLLDSIEAGDLDTVVIAKFNEKMDPVQYQRPTAAPKSGAIDQAEKLVEKLGIERSLKRSLAMLSDITPFWTAKANKPEADGVFGGLRQTMPGHIRSMTASQTMTWAKFVKSMLPLAESIQLEVPYGNAAYVGFTTATYTDAQPILQWDDLGNRNPVAWYLYSGGSWASKWNLTTGAWTDVVAITANPAHRDHPTRFTNHHEFAALVLKGMYDERGRGLSLFPETLRRELHGVRAVIEKYSRTESLTRPIGYGSYGQAACGLHLSEAGATANLKVTAAGVVYPIRIDRWE